MCPLWHKLTFAIILILIRIIYFLLNKKKIRIISCNRIARWKLSMISGCYIKIVTSRF